MTDFFQLDVPDAWRDAIFEADGTTRMRCTERPDGDGFDGKQWGRKRAE